MNPYVLGHWEDNLDVAYAMEHWESGDLGLGEIAYHMCKNDTALGMFPDKTTLGSRYSGCVPTAQQDRSTVTWQGLTAEPADMPQAVLSVVVTRLASATRCGHTTHGWLQSGTLSRTKAHLMTTLHTLITWLGGHLQCVKDGSRALLTVQVLLIGKGRGGLSNSMACD